MEHDRRELLALAAIANPPDDRGGNRKEQHPEAGEANHFRGQIGGDIRDLEHGGVRAAPNVAQEMVSRSTSVGHRALPGLKLNPREVRSDSDQEQSQQQEYRSPVKVQDLHRGYELAAQFCGNVFHNQKHRIIESEIANR